LSRVFGSLDAECEQAKSDKAIEDCCQASLMPLLGLFHAVAVSNKTVENS